MGLESRICPQSIAELLGSFGAAQTRPEPLLQAEGKQMLCWSCWPAKRDGVWDSISLGLSALALNLFIWWLWNAFLQALKLVWKGSGLKQGFAKSAQFPESSKWVLAFFCPLERNIIIFFRGGEKKYLWLSGFYLKLENTIFLLTAGCGEKFHLGTGKHHTPVLLAWVTLGQAHTIFHKERMEILAWKPSPCPPESLACHKTLYLTSESS